jgi:hypothetical protein
MPSLYETALLPSHSNHYMLNPAALVEPSSADAPRGTYCPKNRGNKLQRSFAKNSQLCTCHNMTDSPNGLAAPKAAGAPELTEIEITPAMIEAGLGELLSFSREADVYEEKLKSIYRAMESARLLLEDGGRIRRLNDPALLSNSLV